MEEKYIIRFKNSQAYIKDIENIEYTFIIEDVKQYKKCEIERIITQINKDFEIVEYNKELYRNKNEKYKVFIHTLFSMENVNISDKDIDIYISERKKIWKICCLH